MIMSIKFKPSTKLYRYMAMLLVMAFVITGCYQIPESVYSDSFACDQGMAGRSRIEQLSAHVSFLEFRAGDSFHLESEIKPQEMTYHHDNKISRKSCYRFLLSGSVIPCLSKYFSFRAWNPSVSQDTASQRFIINYIHQQDGLKS